MAHRLACFWALMAIASASMGGETSTPKSATEDEVFALESRVQAGDKAAMRALFAMNTDGAVAEYVTIIIGGVIRAHPKAFLEVVASEPEAQCDRCLDAYLGNLGDDFVDMFRAQVEELKKRRDALRAVNETTLLPVRDKSVSILDVQIAEIESLLRRGIAVQP